jgi:hypothetical protein
METGRFRRDGWTPVRQLIFLDMLARTRSVSRAAAAARLSRESAYRFRKRDPDGLFALLWRAALNPVVTQPTRAQVDEGHRRIIAAGCGPEARNLRLSARHCQNRDASILAEPSSRAGRIWRAQDDVR